ncbi:kinetochore-associated Ndc80 complex subunit nuf2 [Phlyctochytrium planicorne]|nr:kinetochore-associated Ndc80 complex subunit nuf2 [Phlyctochytrium planicorne]
MASYSFPNLKPSEILTCMSDLQIPFSIEDLEKPSTQRILTIFESFTSILMGVSREQFAQPNFAAMEILEYPDLHQESIVLMGFYRQLARLIMNAGFPDFSIKDIIKPEPLRIRKLLSGIINFAKFREERLSVFEDCTRRSADYVDQRQTLLLKNQELAESVNSLRAEEEPAYQKCRERNQVLTAELRELKRIQMALTEEIDTLKKAKLEASEKLTNTQFLLTNGKQDCIRLRSRIVQSPEKLQQAILDMNHTASSEKANIASLEKRIRDLQSKMDHFGVLDQDLVSCMKLMEECELEMKRANAAELSVQSEKESIEKRRLELRDAGMREQQMRRQLNNIEEKLLRLEKQFQSKKEANVTRMIELKAEHEALLREREVNQGKIDVNHKKVAEFEMKVVELKRHMEQEALSLKNDYVALKEKINLFTKALSQGVHNVEIR